MSTTDPMPSSSQNAGAAGAVTALPIEPVVRIRPSRSWVALHVRQL
jgi:hypothetical protein